MSEPASEDTALYPVAVWEQSDPEVSGSRRLHVEVSSADVFELVRRRHPTVYGRGLPVEQAVWFAIDAEGTIVRSWVAQNIYLNFDQYRPLMEHFLPAGSAEEARAVAEHERLEREIIEANVPGMRAAGFYAAYYYSAPGNFAVHFVTESRGTAPRGWRLSPAAGAVAAALRAELER